MKFKKTAVFVTAFALAMSMPLTVAANGTDDTDTQLAAHTHDYSTPVTEQVFHPATGHYEQQLVKEEWTEELYEEQPEYRRYEVAKCTKCGAEFNTVNEWSIHDDSHIDLDIVAEHMANGTCPNAPGGGCACQGSSYTWTTKKEPTGNTVMVLIGYATHPAEYKTLWIIDVPAYMEDVITGY